MATVAETAEAPRLPTLLPHRNRRGAIRAVVTGVQCGTAALTTLSCDPFGTGFDAVEEAIRYQASDISCSAAECQEAIRQRGLRVTTYNIKFGGGRIDFFFDCHGKRVLMNRQEVTAHMAGLAAKVRELDPDVLLIEEADVNSKRAAFVDQVQYLLDHTELNYGAYASQWRADFVPSDGIGAVDSGNAVLSKLPLETATRYALPLRSDQSGIERYFYLHRNMLEVTLTVNDEPLTVIAIHTAAFSKDGTKREHINRLKAKMDETSGLVLAGGDLNALPPGSEQLHNFDDSACSGDYEADDYRAETHWLDALYEDYESAISLERYRDDNSRHFTHTTRADGFWNRKLDYLFTNGHFVPGSGHVSQAAGSEELATMPLSDHAPLSAVLSFRQKDLPQ